MRILYHAINGIGLGHLMRLSAIAVAVRERSPDIHQMFVSSANYPEHFRRMGMPVMVVPGNDAGATTQSDRRMRTISSRLSTKLLDSAITEYDPRLVVFDTHVSRQLVENVLEDGRQAVLVYRKCREEFLLKSLREGLLALFHRILIPHSEEEFCQGLRRTAVQRLMNLETVRFVGNIAFPVGGSVPERYALKRGDKLILVVGGGGGLQTAHQNLFHRACEASVLLRKKRPQIRLICVAGPYGQPTSVPPGCMFVQDEPELRTLMTRAALVIAIPGYNTVQEILQSGARAILIPLERLPEDQEERVAHLARRGRAMRLDARAPTSEYLACMRAILATPRPRPEKCPGAARAAAEILNIAWAPRKLICSRERATVPDALRVSSVSALAKKLRDNHAPESCIRLDWDRVERLFSLLDEEASQRVYAVEIAVGRCSPPEAAERIRHSCGRLKEFGYRLDRTLYTVDDPSGGRLLREMMPLISDVSFQTLVARFTTDSIQQNAACVYEALEHWRRIMPHFKLDITVIDGHMAFVDQP